MIFKHIKALEQPHYYIVTINQTIVTLDTIILEVVLFSQTKPNQKGSSGWEDDHYHPAAHPGPNQNVDIQSNKSEYSSTNC